MHKLFDTVFKLRYVAVLAVIAPFFGAVLMLLVGAKDTIDAYLVFFGLEEPEGAATGGEAAMIRLVASLDHFLFSVVLLLFAIGLYALFFKGASIQTRADGRRRLPSWSHLKNMGGMDQMLLKVIIMLIAVSFLEHLLTTGINNLNWTVLVVPLTIVALAIGLRWMSPPSQERLRQEQAGDNAAGPSSAPGEAERPVDLHE